MTEAERRRDHIIRKRKEFLCILNKAIVYAFLLPIGSFMFVANIVIAHYVNILISVFIAIASILVYERIKEILSDIFEYSDKWIKVNHRGNLY